MRRAILAIALLCLPSVTLSAQIANPSAVDFIASADHSAVVNTVTILTRYDLEVYTPTGTTPVKVQDLGKPTPAGGNLITASLPAVLATVAPGDYVVKIAAVGPGGTSRTAASAPFTVAVRSPVAPGAPTVR